MGDSEASSTGVVTSEVVTREEGATLQSVTKTVRETEGFRISRARLLSESGKVESAVTFPTTSIPNGSLAQSTYHQTQSTAHSMSDDKHEHTVSTVETSHMESTQESVVHVESVVQEAAAVTQKEVSQTHSITAMTSSSEATAAVEEALQPPAVEAQPVDENANSIPDEQVAVETTRTSEPEPKAEPIPETVAEHSPEPASDPKPEQAQETEAPPAPEPAPEPASEPAPEPAPEPVQEPAPEPTSEPAAEPAPEPTSEPAAEPVAELAPVPAPEPVPEPTSESTPKEAVEESAAEPEVQPVAEERREDSAAEEISQENIKTQLHEIISEIEQEVMPEHDEDGTLRHTWRPKGKYDLQKTEIVYEDIVPIQLPDVNFSQVAVKPQPPAPVPQPPQQPMIPQQTVPIQVPNNLDGLTNGSLVPGDLPPIEIPEGIPLLARILPKTEQGLEGDKKISLERLFTPATDSGDMTPIKKKAFASSAFYRPDHPTIDDQVELAQRISFSLIDENNKMSRGQTMYMKRKNRSMKWIHEDPGFEFSEDGVNRPPARRPVSMPHLDEGENKEKPAMKLLMSSKGVQDFHQVQEHYHNLMNQAPQSPEVKQIVTEVSSPSGKGAELFAKRKKRMDKFIVDETTVQKSQQTSMTQQSSSSSFSSVASSSVSSSQNIATGVSLGPPAATPGAGPMYTAEVKVVQRASLPPTPVDGPHHSLLDLVDHEKEDKRLSASFNLAAKGWGTYNNFYSPITFATKS